MLGLWQPGFTTLIFTIHPHQKSHHISVLLVLEITIFRWFSDGFSGRKMPIFRWFPTHQIPISSLYGIFTNICPIYDPNVGKYSIHGSYGIWIQLGGTTDRRNAGAGEFPIFCWRVGGGLHRRRWCCVVTGVACLERVPWLVKVSHG